MRETEVLTLDAKNMVAETVVAPFPLIDTYKGHNQPLTSAQSNNGVATAL